jgi:hypothetical protein
MESLKFYPPEHPKEFKKVKKKKGKNTLKLKEWKKMYPL